MNQNRAVIGLVDTDIDKKIDFSNVRAQPLKPGKFLFCFRNLFCFILFYLFVF